MGLSTTREELEKEKELTNLDILYDMLPFIYSLIQEIYKYNQNIYNFGKKEIDVNNSSTTGYNFDSFNGTPPIIIYRSLYVNDNSWPYYAEINTEKLSIDKKKPFLIVKKPDNKYIPIGCKQDGTIAYAFVA